MTIEVNANFDERVLLRADELEWVPSPMPGVERRMLDRIGGEVARATSIVRYAPGSQFSPHTHHGGEEFLILEGVFQDEHADYPAGSYVRNPPTTSHTPGSEPGCVMLVKLWQFDKLDRTQFAKDMNTQDYAPMQGSPGISFAVLHEDERERVELQLWEPGTAFAADLPGGAEFFVLDGSATESGEGLRKHSWLRVPVGGAVNFVAGPEGARIWFKSGGLRFVEAPAAG